MSKLIVAVDENSGIGKDNNLLFDCPTDMKNFIIYTKGKTVLMGRTTYQSLNSPLKDRKNIIVTRDKSFRVNNEYIGKYDIEIVNSIEEVIKEYKESGQELIIIGGSSVYEQSLPYVDEVRLTKFHHTKEADSFFNVEYIERYFEVVEKDEYDVCGLRFDITTHRRKVDVDA